MTPRIVKTIARQAKRQREGMSAGHLDAVRALPCLRCGLALRNDAHHLRKGLPVGERGMGRRAADRYSLPLCRACHEAVEATGDDEAVLASWGIDGRAVAAALWRVRGDRKSMARIVARSLNARGVYVS
jgi:hypothetical protein